MPEDIAVKEKAPRDRRFFKAVCNYMSNVLKIDRDFVRKTIDKKVETMGVESLVERNVKRYFGFGPDAHNADSWFKARIDKTVDKYVRDAMDDGMRGWLDKAIQDQMDVIAGRMGTRSVTASPRPGMETWNGTFLLSNGLVSAYVGKWLQEHIPENEKLAFGLDMSTQTGPVVNVRNLKETDIDAMNDLRREPGRYNTFLGSAVIDRYMLTRLLENQLGLPKDSIGRMSVLSADTVVLFSRCSLETANEPENEDSRSDTESWNIIKLDTSGGTRYLGHSCTGDILVDNTKNANRYKNFADAMQIAIEAGIKFRCNAVPKRLTISWTLDDVNE